MGKKILVSLVAIFVLASVHFADAQQSPKIPQIGILSPYSASDSAVWHQAFRQGLSKFGWIEGKNISIEYRYSEGKDDRLPALAAELVRLKVDVIVTSITPDTLAAKNATTTIPIVMASVADPVGSGFVDGLALPGGNITGLTNIAPELSGKWLELLKDTVPKLTRVAVLWNPEGTISPFGWKESQLPARALGLRLYSMEVRSSDDFDNAFKDATKAGAGAVDIVPNVLVTRNQKRIVDLAVKNRLPAIYGLTDFVNFGGLMAYGPDRSDLFRRAAAYVDKILKGRRPADLPVEQPMKFEFIINLKAAKQIDLTIPPNALARADKVIR